jgi:arginase family enzyme
MSPSLGLIGVPASAGAFAPGQEQAPQALRDGGLCGHVVSGERVGLIYFDAHARCERLLVHFDVDVIDFTDVPLSENVGRNEGLQFDHALRALDELLATPSFAGLTITELNPDHAELGSHSIERFAAAVAGSIAGALAIKRNGQTRSVSHTD